MEIRWIRQYSLPLIEFVISIDATNQQHNKNDHAQTNYNNIKLFFLI